MQLLTLGRLELDGCNSSKLSPQLLLLLSYLRLEGKPSKAHLAQLFWPHLAQSFSKRGERKDLNNVSVAFATLRRESGLKPETVQDLECDAIDFSKAFQKADYSQALELYEQDGFLADIENKPRLKLSDELYSWIVQKRTLLAKQAFYAAIHLTEQDKTHPHMFLEQAKQLWQESFGLQVFAKLYKTAQSLNALSPDLIEMCQQLASTHLQDLPEEMLEFYLLLALNQSKNVSAARLSANLSPKQAIAFQKELSQHGFLTETLELTTEMLAKAYLERHPSKHFDLLTRLASNTSTNACHPLFEQIYALSDSFGGMGFWPKAQDAYIYQAEHHLKEQQFAKAIECLTTFITVEKTYQQIPDAYIRFLYAYTLARVSRYAEALKTLEGVHESLEVRSIKAGLLLATGNKVEAELMAKGVLDDPYQSRQTDWAKAIAANTLGSIHHFRQALTEADQYLAQAAVHFELAGMHYRSLGMQFNRVSILIDMGNKEKASRILKRIIKKTENHVLLQVRSLINLGFIHLLQNDYPDALFYFDKAYQHTKQEAFARTHVGIYASTLSTWSILAYTTGKLSKAKATEQLQKASQLLQQSGNRKEHSKTLLHLALVQEDLAAFESSWLLLKQFAGIHECAIYKPAYQSLLEQYLKQAKAQQDTQTESFYHDKLERLEHEDLVTVMEHVSA